MASASGVVWAIDIGNCSLKALRLVDTGAGVQVTAFDNISHGKILTGTGVSAQEKEELIALSLQQLITNNNISKEDIIISVPSENSFSRFVTLPPVEKKRIPEIVNFEAAQQIPFDIKDVQWDWQRMSDEHAAEVKVGIFAIKSEIVNEILGHFTDENLQVTKVQMASMALYNYLIHDRKELFKTPNEATAVLNIGAESSDLVICTGQTVWQRCIPMGGNAFTKAIANTFKLNFQKAEKLKKTAAMSKYARQIFQAMRPVFTDLASEVQRSIGFYSSSNPGVSIKRIVALGGGCKMRGLLKYLQQTLQVPIEMPDAFKKLGVNEEVSSAKFHDNVCNFGVVYGLGIQGLGYGKIESNLLPASISRSMEWRKKAKIFNAAAVLLLLVSLLALARGIMAGQSYSSNDDARRKLQVIISEADQNAQNLENEKSRALESERIIKEHFDVFENREMIGRIYETVIRCLPNAENTPSQAELYDAFERGDAQAILKHPEFKERSERKQIFVTSFSVKYTNDLESESIGPKDSRQYDEGGSEDQDVSKVKGFVISIAGYSPNQSLGQLIDPVVGKDDPSKWGFVTRLENLDKIFDSNSPFDLYERDKIGKHFKLSQGDVEVGAWMPQGVGIPQAAPSVADERSRDDKFVLIDPMTREVISKVVLMDENGKAKIDRLGNPIYKVNDHWFTLDFKLALRTEGEPGIDGEESDEENMEDI